MKANSGPDNATCIALLLVPVYLTKFNVNIRLIMSDICACVFPDTEKTE